VPESAFGHLLHAMRVCDPSLRPEQAGASGAGHAQRSIRRRPGDMSGPRMRMVPARGAGYYACEITLPLERTSR